MKKGKKKCNNLIIFGLKMNGNDNDFKSLKDLCEELGVDTSKIKNISRVVKKNLVNDMAPIKIEVDSIDTKFAILKAAKKLEQINIKYVNSNASLTLVTLNRHTNISGSFLLLWLFKYLRILI
jgi:hypothetical protein